MKQLRSNKNYILYRTEDKMYQVFRKKDKKQSKLLTKDEAESLIIDEAFNKECKTLSYE
jgi:hypothetical protein